MMQLAGEGAAQTGLMDTQANMLKDKPRLKAIITPITTKHLSASISAGTNMYQHSSTLHT